jgi:hypothetical protein
VTGTIATNILKRIEEYVFLSQSTDLTSNKIHKYVLFLYLDKVKIDKVYCTLQYIQLPFLHNVSKEKNRFRYYIA